MTLLTIEDLEVALCFHMRHHKRGDPLPASASMLADVYGSMIFFRQRTAAWRLLSDDQADLVRVAIERYQQDSLFDQPPHDKD